MPTTVADVVAKSVTGYGLPSVAPEKVNVGDTERVVSLALGGLLAGYGLTTSGLSRVALPILGGALALRGITGWCAAYSALGIDTSCERNDATAVEANHGVKIEESTTIHKPAAELFAFWRTFSNLPRFMAHLKDVKVQNRTRSHWVATGPLGVSVEWDAEVINEKPDELIAWRSLPGSDIDTAGSVHFVPSPSGRGTEVRVTLKYDPPAGKVGHAVAKLFGKDAAQQVRSDLRRLKHLLEASEIPVSLSR